MTFCTLVSDGESAKSSVGVSPATPDRMGGQTGHPNRVTLSAVKGLPFAGDSSLHSE